MARRYEYFRNSDTERQLPGRAISSTDHQLRAAVPLQQFRASPSVARSGFPKLNEKLREKLFFFVGEDWIRYRYMETQTAGSADHADAPGEFQRTAGVRIPWYSGSHVIYDPSTCASVGAASCVPFPGNIIPASQLSHNGIAHYQRLPHSHSRVTWSGYPELDRAGGAPDQPAQRRSSNFDILPTTRTGFTGRRTDAAYFEYQPFDQGSGLTGKYFNRPNQTNAVSWTRTISPTLINEARLTFSLDDVYIPVNTSLAGFNRSQFGINFPYLLPRARTSMARSPPSAAWAASTGCPADRTRRTRRAPSGPVRTRSPRWWAITPSRPASISSTPAKTTATRST